MRKIRNHNLAPIGILKPLDSFCSELIKRATPAEKQFNEWLKTFSSERYKFQIVFGWFILDFLFLDRAVAVELDGSSHDNKEQYDRQRDEWVQKFEIETLRYTNSFVQSSPGEVLEDILKRPVVSQQEVTRRILRANSERVVCQEKKLAEKGLRHDNTGHVVSIGYSTSRHSTIIQVPDRVFSVPYKGCIRKRYSCPNCRTHCSSLNHRCFGCSAILRFGEIKQLEKRPRTQPVVDSLVPILVRRGRTNGKRPKCPHCQRGLAQHWTNCQGCQAVISWV